MRLRSTPPKGIAKDAKIDTAGFNNVLKLPVEIEGQWDGTPPNACNIWTCPTTKRPWWDSDVDNEASRCA